MIQVTGTMIPVRQPEPPEGRAAIPVVKSDGSPLKFTTGAEIFSFSSDSIRGGGVRPSGILSVWIDATGLAGANAFLLVDNGLQVVQVPVGDQGFTLFTCPMPVNVKIYGVNITAGGVAVVVLYNYNIYASGSFSVGAPVGGEVTAGGTVAHRFVGIATRPGV